MVKKQLDSKQLLIQKTLDENKETSRAYNKFRQAIKRPTTLRAYNLALDRFMITSKLRNYDQTIKIKPGKIQELLETYVISIKNLSYQSVNQRLAGIELFFDMNMILYHKKILRKLLPGNDNELGGKLPYTTKEINKMLDVATKLRSKAIIHFFASTGCRPSCLDDPILRLKHIETMPFGCKSVYVYDGSKESYYAFLTPEASKSLESYFNQRKLNGEKLTNESCVFANVSNFPTTIHENISQNSTRQIIKDVIFKAGIERKLNGHRYDKAIIYGFRKRFNTILKLNNDVNSNIAEKLMAHKRGLDGTYLQPTKEECFKEFLKAVPDLTINETERQKLEIEVLEDENNKLEQMNQDNLTLARKIRRIEHHGKMTQENISKMIQEELKRLREKK